MVPLFYFIVSVYSSTKYYEYGKVYKRWRFPLTHVMSLLVGSAICQFIDLHASAGLIKSLTLAIILVLADWIARFIAMPTEEECDSRKKFVDHLGLVDPLNLCLFGIVLFFAHFLRESDFMAFVADDSQARTEHWLEAARLGLAIVKDSVFFFGTLYSITFSILFAKANWGESLDDKGAKQHRVNYHTASRIIAGFLLAAICCFIWVVRPLSAKILAVASALL